MTHILFVVVIFTLAMLGMALSLHFSAYKKRPSGCCGGMHCDTTANHHASDKKHPCHHSTLNALEKIRSE